LIIIGIIIFFLFKKRNDKKYFYLKGDNKTYVIQNLDRGIIGVGGAGSGKTFSLINPLLAHLIEERGVLCFDPKGDLSDLINKKAIQVKKPIINFSLDKNYDRINPLTLCEDKSDIIDFSSYFLSGIVGIPKNDNAKYFFNSAKSILTGVIILLKNKGKRYYSIPHVIALFLTVSPEELIKLLSSDKEAKRASTILLSVKDDPKLLGSIISTFTAFFASLDTPKIFRNLVTEEILNLPNNPENPSVVNLIFNLQKRDLYSPIYSSIIGLLLKKMNTSNQYKSAVVIDEFTCLAIPDFQNIPETARSNKIATCIAIQDFSQLVNRYDKEVASSIISNMGTQLLFRTTSPETLDHFQRTLGTREVKKESKTTPDFSITSSKTVSFSDRDIIRKEDIIKFKPGQAWGIIAEGNHHLIEADRVNGNHYLKGLDNIKFELKSANDEQESYESVYKDIGELLGKNKSQPPVKFNI
jgi:type IV secretory pathway TraG/TraD family ATPase VirD4